MDNTNEMRSYCGSAGKLKEYLQRKAVNHNSYKYYSKIEYIRTIVKDRILYLGNGAKWNDVSDRESFVSESDCRINFGKCFSYSTDENVAMWMLYGGVYHRGAMIDFTKRAMRNICDCSTITLGNMGEDGFKPLFDIEKPKFDIRVIDVVYYNSENGYIKRSNESVFGVKTDMISTLGAYKKTYPWSYENECRLVVTIDKALVPTECNTVKIDMSGIDLGKSLERVYYCPDFRETREDGFNKSKLQDLVEWELIEAGSVSAIDEGVSTE